MEQKEAFPRHDVIHWPTEGEPARLFIKDPGGLTFDTGEGKARGHFDFSECEPPDYQAFPLNGRNR